MTPASTVVRVAPDRFRLGSRRRDPPRTYVGSSGRPPHADGAAPLDEAALLALRHPASRVLGAVDGRARRRASPGCTTAPSTWWSRRRRAARGSVRRWPRRPSRPPVALTAWSHGNHPAAAALAARSGLDRVRDLWVMRRSLVRPPRPRRSGRRGRRTPVPGGRRRGRVPRRQRRRLRPPPRAGRDDPRRPRRPDRRAVVRPGRLLPRLARRTSCSASTGPRCTPSPRRRSARCTSSGSSRTRRAAASAGC